MRDDLKLAECKSPTDEARPFPHPRTSEVARATKQRRHRVARAAREGFLDAELEQLEEAAEGRGFKWEVSG